MNQKIRVFYSSPILYMHMEKMPRYAILLATER